jgi:hypothetical protein
MASNLLDKLSENATNIGSKISENVEKVTNTVQNASNNAVNATKNITDNVSQNLEGVTSNVITGMSGISDTIGEKIQNILPYDSSNFLSSSSDFLNSNNFIAHIIFIILAIVLFIVFFKLGVNLISLLIEPSGSPYLYENMKDGKQLVIIPQDPKVKGSIPILRSRNQYDGLEFSYSCWIYVDDPTYRSNQHFKHIFHKGNDFNDNDGIFKPNNSPGLYLFNGVQTDKVENPNRLDNYDYSNPVISLLVRQNIFTDQASSNNNDSKIYYEDVVIESIPIKKWVCIIIRVNNQNVLDVFINGKLMKRKKLSGAVRQNYDNVYINMNGGFSGFLSSLRYFNYSLGTFEISSIVNNGPSLKMDESSTVSQSKPRYLSSKWFFSTSNPAYN